MSEPVCSNCEQPIELSADIEHYEDTGMLCDPCFADALGIEIADTSMSEPNECPQCGSDLERVTCPNCGGMRVEHATGWTCGECDEDGEVLVCAQPGCERRGVVVEVSA